MRMSAGKRQKRPRSSVNYRESSSDDEVGVIRTQNERLARAFARLSLPALQSRCVCKTVIKPSRTIRACLGLFAKKKIVQGDVIALLSFAQPAQDPPKHAVQLHKSINGCIYQAYTKVAVDASGNLHRADNGWAANDGGVELVGDRWQSREQVLNNARIEEFRCHREWPITVLVASQEIEIDAEIFVSYGNGFDWVHSQSDSDLRGFELYKLNAEVEFLEENADGDQEWVRGSIRAEHDMGDNQPRDYEIQYAMGTGHAVKRVSALNMKPSSTRGSHSLSVAPHSGLGSANKAKRKVETMDLGAGGSGGSGGAGGSGRTGGKGKEPASQHSGTPVHDPILLSRSINDDETTPEHYNNYWDTLLGTEQYHNKPDNMVVFRAPCLELKLEDFKTLQGQTWVNDTILSWWIKIYWTTYLGILPAGSIRSNVGVADTWLYTKLSQIYQENRRKKKQVEKIKAYDRVNTKLENYIQINQTLQWFDRIVMLVNHENTHWFVVCVDIQKEAELWNVHFTVYDSKRSMQIDIVPCIDTIKAWLDYYATISGLKKIQYHTHIASCPQQLNDYDCGLFAAVNAALLSLFRDPAINKKPTPGTSYTQTNVSKFRVWLAREIATHANFPSPEQESGGDDEVMYTGVSHQGQNVLGAGLQLPRNAYLLRL